MDKARAREPSRNRSGPRAREPEADLPFVPPRVRPAASEHYFYVLPPCGRARRYFQFLFPAPASLPE